MRLVFTTIVFAALAVPVPAQVVRSDEGIAGPPAAARLAWAAQALPQPAPQAAPIAAPRPAAQPAPVAAPRPAAQAAPLAAAPRPAAQPAPVAAPQPAPQAAPVAASRPAAQPAPVAAPAARLPSLPPEGWAPQDPADSLWRAARQALDRGDNVRAAGMYRRIRTESRFARSEYRQLSYYWEAFARHRVGTTAELRQAQNVLGSLLRTYPDFERRAEAERLVAQINGALAARGDAPAAARAAATASQAAACPNQDLRAAAVEALIAMPADQALPVLETVMARKDECNAKLRETALFIIGQKGGARAEDLLLAAATSDPSPQVREQAVFWLSRVNSEKAVNAIQEILRTNPDSRMMEAAVMALSQQKHPRAAQLLRDIAARPGASIETRKAAVIHMGRARNAETTAFLRQVYAGTTEAGLKEAVIFAMMQRRTEEDAAWLLDIATNQREPIEVRKQALFVAAQQRSALPFNRLVQLYASMPDREMREQIIFAMSQRKDEDAVEHLIEMARRETDPQLKRHLIFWLGRTGDPRAVRFLAELVGG
jgi:HEAT repeat protein